MLFDSISREKVVEWLEERVPVLRSGGEFLRTKMVPRHKYTFFYIFGGLSLFLFLTQLISGVLLALYYSPTPDKAHESVRRIMDEVEFGWIVRSVHSWGANLIVAVTLIHMFSAYFMKAYRRPRELVWVSGVLVLFVVLGFAFTGYLLPWDTTAYFATLIGTEIPKSLPVLGELMVTVLRGESDVGEEALRRMFTIHTIILPLGGSLLMGLHVLLQQSVGTSSPRSVEGRQPQIPFLPNFVYRDLFAWTACGALLMGLAFMLPVGLGDKADPYASAPIGIRPEWYFLPLYQTLRMFPTRLLTLSGEMIVNCCVGLLAFFWMVVPFLDGKASRNEDSAGFTWVGAALLAFSVATVVLAYAT